MPHPGIDPGPLVQESNALTSDHAPPKLNVYIIKHNPSTVHIRIRIHSINMTILYIV